MVEGSRFELESIFVCSAVEAEESSELRMLWVEDEVYTLEEEEFHFEDEVELASRPGSDFGGRPEAVQVQIDIG